MINNLLHGQITSSEISQNITMDKIKNYCHILLRYFNTFFHTLQFAEIRDVAVKLSNTKEMLIKMAILI